MGQNDITWSTGETSSSIWVTPSQTTTYSVTVDDGIASCTDDIEIAVNNPSIDLGADTLTICSADSVLLDAGAGFDTYSWNTGETTQSIYANSSGTYSATVSQGDAVVNDHSMSFDGNDDYVDVPANSSLDINDAITVSAWVKSNSIELSEIAGRMEANCTDEGYRISLRNTGDIWAGFGCYNSNDIAVASNAYTPNQWVYITCVFKNNTYVKISIDGVLQDSVQSN